MDWLFLGFEVANAQGMQIKMLQSRSLFYLSEGAKTSGTMSLAEFEQTMLAGQVDFEIANAIVESLQEDGKDFIEFLKISIQNTNYTLVFCIFSHFKVGVRKCMNSWSF